MTAENIVNSVYSAYIQAGGGPSALNYILVTAQQDGISQDQLMQAFTVAYGGAAQDLGRQIAASATTITISPALAAAAGVTAGTVRLTNAPAVISSANPSSQLTSSDLTAESIVNTVYSDYVDMGGGIGVLNGIIFTAITRGISYDMLMSAFNTAYGGLAQDLGRQIAAGATTITISPALAAAAGVTAGTVQLTFHPATHPPPSAPSPAPASPMPQPTPSGPATDPAVTVAAAAGDIYAAAGGGDAGWMAVGRSAGNANVSNARLIALWQTVPTFWAKVVAEARAHYATGLAIEVLQAAGQWDSRTGLPVSTVIPTPAPPPIPVPAAIIPTTRVTPGVAIPPHPTVAPEDVVRTVFSTFNNAGGGPTGANTVKALATSWGMTWDQVGQAFHTAWGGVTSGLWSLLNSDNPPAQLEDPRHATVAGLGGMFGSPWVLGGAAALAIVMLSKKRR